VTQPDPKPNNHPAVWDMVIADMRRRDAEGRAHYRVPLQPYNGRDALLDAYEESLDAAAYLRQEIYQRRWIPVTEMLPEVYQRVLVWDTWTKNIYIARLLSGCWRGDDPREGDLDVSHWKPLPDGPGEYEGDGK
jgi:hypothetical protein